MRLMATSFVVAIAALCILPQLVLATGTLFDTGVQQCSFADGSGTTPISAENDGVWVWTASGGSPSGPRLARYTQGGALDQTFSPGIDFRALYTDNAGNLHAKEFGAGNVFSITPGGVPTLLYTLNDPQSQSAAGLNGPDTELYTMDAPTLRRYNAANGAFLGSVNLIGMSGAEMGSPQAWQMETNNAGRIFTYSDGTVSEWDLGGNRIGTCVIPIGTPADFATNWSFGMGGDLIYLFNAQTNGWECYSCGVEQPTAVEPTTWGRIKTHYRPAEDSTE